MRGSIWMTARGLEAIVEAVDPRNADRLPVWRDTGRRRRDSHLSFLRDREEARQEPRGVRPGRDRGRGRSRGREQCVGRRAPWCRCSRSGCRPPRRRRSCSPAFQQYGLQPGPLLFDNNADLRLGTDRQPLHRQRDAARPQPAAGRALGALLRSRGRGSMAASSSSPRWARSDRQSPSRSSACCSSSGCSASLCAVRLSDRAGGRRPDPRAARRAAAAPRAGDQPG